MSAGGRPTARITVLETGEVLELEYRYPLIDVSGSSRTVTHEPIGVQAVVQHLGADARELEMRGHCYRDEANIIDTLSLSGKIELRSDRWSGYAIVTSHNTTHTKAKGGARPENTHENKNFDYRISLKEAPAPSL